MENSEINHPLFRAAVEAMDAGDLSALRRIVEENPGLAAQRLDAPAEGYFKHPYLLWFAADNPIRHHRLPANTPEITALLVEAARRDAPETFQDQIDYALGLTVTGLIPKESGVQNAMMDVLIDAGAVPGKGNGALAHGNPGAVRHLMQRGGDWTLAAAVCLRETAEIQRLAPLSNDTEQVTALVAAAFSGLPDQVAWLIGRGVNVNAWPDPSEGFHSHATALHQAVSSGSLDCVKLLVEAGASLKAADRVYQGTPLGWALHMAEEAGSVEERENYNTIASWLREAAARR